jgi:DNA-directed RNA polymerase specialized sigma24 family protein
LSEGFGHRRIAQEGFEALVQESLSELCRYAYWLCGDWTTAESLIGATLASGQCALGAAGKDEATRLRRMIATMHKEHVRQRDKQDASIQSHSVDRAGDKGADVELQNLRIGLTLLPAKYREPLVLQSLNYSIADIAKLLEFTTVIVAARLAHARKQLQVIPNLDDDAPYFTPDNS